MRKQFLFAGAMFSVCLSTTALYAATNLITNGGFEQSDAPGNADGGNPTGWVLTGGADGVYVDPTEAVDGTRYVQLGQFGQLQQFLGSYVLHTGDVIHLQGYGKSFALDNHAYNARIFADPAGTSQANLTNGDTVIDLEFPNVSPMTLEQADYTVTAAEAGKVAGLYLATGPQFDGFDAFSATVTPAPEPATLSLIGAGAALLLRRRRAGIA